MIGIDLIRSLKADGITIVLVEHVMNAVRALCDRCVVMSSGRKIAEGATADVLARCGCREGLSWRGGRRCLRSHNLSLAYGLHRALDGVALDVGRGEIVTILGANGAGKTSLLKAIAGRRADAAGQAGEPRRPRSLGAAGARDRRKRAGAGARRARHLRRPDGEGKSPARRQPATRAPRRAKRRGASRCSALFPRLRERAAPDRAHHERRRAADARHRPRADVEPGYPAARRAVARALAAAWCRSCSRRCARVREAGVGVLLVEQNAQAEPATSPTAAMCSKTAASSGTAPPIV